jgi:outer membrane receptor protein involved in Fe transport
MKTTLATPALAALTALLGPAAGALAQTAAAPASTNPRPSGDVITLSEFNVTAEGDRGYVASETLTGTRVRTPIIDLPYTVNVLTSEFFEDFGIFELSDNLVHVGSFTGLDIGGGFTLRGFGSSYQLRDGFFRLGRYGSSNIDRMEIIKGSNAAIYGRTSPGGMVNMISKQPKSRAGQRLMLNYGDYGTQRVTLESTGPIADGRYGKTSYIATGSLYQREFDMEYARNRNNEYYLALSHTFPDKSNLFVSAEYFFQERDAPNSAAPLIIDQKGTATNTDDEAVGYATNLAAFNAFGPNSELHRGYSGITAFYDKRLNETWSVRAAANYYGARRWDYNQNTGWGAININPANAATPITSARGATPSKGLIIEDGGGVQADLLAHYFLRNRSIENRTLLTLDINDYYRWDPTRNYGVATDPDLVAWNAVRTVRLDANLRPIDPIAYFPKRLQLGKEVSTRIRKMRATVTGGLIRHQSAFLKGDLLTYAGARYDSVRFRHRDFLNPPAGFAPGQMLDKTMTELKPNFGVNYKLTRNLRIFANYSESYFVPQADAPATVAERDYQSETAEGYDYGFKGGFLNDRLTFTVSGFYATRNNVSVTDVEETPVGSGNYVTTQRRDGNQLVRGFEIDVNWRATDQLSFGGSFGHVYSIYTDFGSAFPLSVGRRVNGVSPQNGSVYARYAGKGALRNFSGNIGVTHVGATPTAAPNAGDTYSTTASGERVITRSTYEWRLKSPAYTLVNIGLRYRLPDVGRYSHNIAVNINNVLDKEYFRANRLLGEERAFYFTYTLNRGAGMR